MGPRAVQGSARGLHDADGQSHIWTTDNGNHVVREFTSDGKLLATIGEVDTPGAGPAHFRSPDDIVIGSKGDLFIADSGNGRIVHLSRDGKFIAEWGREGSGPSLNSRWRTVWPSIKTTGSTWRTGAMTSVQVFQPDGKLSRYLDGIRESIRPAGSRQGTARHRRRCEHNHSPR